MTVFLDWQIAHCLLDEISSQNEINCLLSNDPLLFASLSVCLFLCLSMYLSLCVQISATKADPNVSFMVQTCFISVNSNPAVPSDYILIENVCPTDESLLYYSQKADRMRFSFNFKSKFKVPLLFLHCEMSVCTETPHSHQGLPEVRSFTFPQSSPLLSSFLFFFPALLTYYSILPLPNHPPPPLFFLVFSNLCFVSPLMFNPLTN